MKKQLKGFYSEKIFIIIFSLIFNVSITIFYFMKEFEGFNRNISIILKDIGFFVLVLIIYNLFLGGFSVAHSIYKYKKENKVKNVELYDERGYIIKVNNFIEREILDT